MARTRARLTRPSSPGEQAPPTGDAGGHESWTAGPGRPDPRPAPRVQRAFDLELRSPDTSSDARLARTEEHGRRAPRRPLARGTPFPSPADQPSPSSTSDGSRRAHTRRSPARSSRIHIDLGDAIGPRLRRSARAGVVRPAGALAQRHRRQRVRRSGACVRGARALPPDVAFSRTTARPSSGTARSACSGTPPRSICSSTPPTSTSRLRPVLVSRTSAASASRSCPVSTSRSSRRSSTGPATGPTSRTCARRNPRRRPRGRDPLATSVPTTTGSGGLLSL